MGEHERERKRDDREDGAGAGAGAGEHKEVSVADVRTRVWELHLRGLPRTRIAEQVGLNRQTVGKYIAACLREQMGAEQRQKREQMLAAAVARMRRVQEQAWADHDADDERERAVLALVIGEGDGEREGREGREGRAKDAKQEGVSSEGRGERGSAGGRVMVRYQSQRSQYLRVVLDAEREIARLCGLYEAGLALDGAVVFRLERVESGGASASRTRNVSVDADITADEDGFEDAGE